LATPAERQKTSGLGPEYQYDLTELLKVDPALIHYQEAARVQTGMQEPRGIAVATDGRLLIAGNRAVRTFDAAGKAAGEFATEGLPHGLAVGPMGTIFVAMKDHVETFDAFGKRLAAWESLGEKAYLTSVAAGQEDVFVADAGARAVVRYDPSGRAVKRIAGTVDEKGEGGFLIPSPYFDVALGRDRLVWIVNPGMRRVECYTYEGEFRKAWGKASPSIEGFCGCCNPIHIAIAPDGSFVTSEKGLPRVKVCSPQGALVSVVAPPSAFAAGTSGLDVAVDADGRVFVLDPRQRTVRVFVKKKA
jgi:sugar lactone lactonase YvrE